ncbi:MAG: RtcB family protein [Selenomonadaceae bacterium]
MITIEGKENTAIVFTDEVDDNVRGQLTAVCDAPYLSGSKIRVMPDVHAGKGCTIGTTMTIDDNVVPNMVGVDIGCGMETVLLKERRIDLPKLDSAIREYVPSGRNVRPKGKPHKLSRDIDLSKLHYNTQDEHIERTLLSIGTLGGGNHFIEIDKDDEGQLYLVIHSGSRHLGLEVANYYQDLGYKKLYGTDKNGLAALIAKLKAEGREREIEAAIKARKHEARTSKISHDMAYVSGELFDDYIDDMRTTQRFAMLNRRAMADEIIRKMHLTPIDSFTTVHNYIDTDAMILRKGAVSAKRGERLLIPMNMRDGSLICIGKGNDDWNESAPHGAGRVMSRTEARHTIGMGAYRDAMKDIFTTCVSKDTVDEAPMAYKTMDSIVKNIGPTADIVKLIKPIYNFKAQE